MPHLALPQYIALGLLGVLAAAYDLRYRRIPNVLVAAGCGAGVVIQFWLYGFAGGYASLLGAGLALAVYLPLFVLRAVGGGDLKLMAAVGAIAGPAVWLVLFILASLLGGVCAVVLIVVKARFVGTLDNIGTIVREVVHLRRPYRNRSDLDVTSDRGLRLPHGAVIGAAIELFLMHHWLG